MDLSTQIRAYAEWVEDDQQPVTAAELTASNRLAEQRQPVTRRHGVWIAAAAATVTVLLVGTVALLLRADTRVPPADTVPPPTLTGEDSFFAPGAVPDGFVLDEVSVALLSGRNATLTYRRTTPGGVWLPGDGGFSIESMAAIPGPDTAGAGAADPVAAADSALAALLTAVPGAGDVDVAGRRGVLLETTLAQGDVRAPHVSLLVHDRAGGLYEVTALGMTVDEVTAIAADVTRVPLAELRSLETTVDWTHLAVVLHESFAVDVPDVVRVVSSSFRMVLGADLLVPRLIPALLAAEVVREPGPSSLGYVLLSARDDLSAGEVAAALEQDPDVAAVALSPTLSQAHADQFFSHARAGAVLAEEPWIVQAPAPPPPGFSTAALGTEVPLVPASSAGVVPDYLVADGDHDRPVATAEQPMVVVGTAEPADPLAGRPTLVVWSTMSGDICTAMVIGTTSSAGCGRGPTIYGAAGEVTGGDGDAVSYVVPPETSVVQIVTPGDTYWQRPIIGYGVVPYGGSVPRPTEFVALAADGTELGRWATSRS